MIIHELHARYGDAPKLTFNTMDPTEQIGMGADTKMLRAGWGNWGTKPEKATISADMMHSKDWANRSGQGFARRREIADPASRKKLWDECVRLTGAMYD